MWTQYKSQNGARLFPSSTQSSRREPPTRGGAQTSRQTRPVAGRKITTAGRRSGHGRQTSLKSISSGAAEILSEFREILVAATWKIKSAHLLRAQWNGNSWCQVVLGELSWCGTQRKGKKYVEVLLTVWEASISIMKIRGPGFMPTLEQGEVLTP